MEVMTWAECLVPVAVLQSCCCFEVNAQSNLGVQCCNQKITLKIKNHQRPVQTSLKLVFKWL